MMGKQHNRRSIYRKILSPRMQLQYGAYYALIAGSVLLLWGGLAIFFMLKVLSYSQEAAHGLSVSQYLKEVINQNKWIFVGGFFASAIMFMGLAVLLTERIAGPMHALLRHIQSLKEGRFEHKTYLRKDDELKPLMIALNELSDVFKEKYGSDTAESSAPLDKTGTDA